MQRYKEQVARSIEQDKEYIRAVNTNTPPALAEDKAFMRKMNNLRFNERTDKELARVYKIALSGLYVRSNVDKAFADISRHESEKIAHGTINNGLKYTEIFRRAREDMRNGKISLPHSL